MTCSRIAWSLLIGLSPESEEWLSARSDEWNEPRLLGTMSLSVTLCSLVRNFSESTHHARTAKLCPGTAATKPACT